MINIVEQNGKTIYNVISLICDELTDITNLKTDAAPGSTCFVISTSDVYMLNNKKEWVKL